MTIIDGNTDNLGVDTVLSDTKEHTVCLDFSMMMGLDLGFSSYVQQEISGFRFRVGNKVNFNSK